jgi:hypothetical protein
MDYLIILFAAFCALLPLALLFEARARETARRSVLAIARLFVICLHIAAYAIGVAIGVLLGAGKLLAKIELRMQYTKAAIAAIENISLTFASLGAVGILLPEASQATVNAAKNALLYGMIVYTIAYTIRQILKKGERQ